MDPAAFVAWQGELGLEKGAQGGNVQDGVVKLGRRNALPSTLLLFDFSGLLCFVYEPRCPMEKLPNPTGAAFLGACVRVCCEEEGDLSGSESCSKPVGGKIAIVVSLVSDVV